MPRETLAANLTLASATVLLLEAVGGATLGASGGVASRCRREDLGGGTEAGLPGMVLVAAVFEQLKLCCC